MARTLSAPAARPETEDGRAPDGRARSGIATGNVALTATVDWMTGGKVASASLTPAEARQLAVDLLVAAERVEGTYRHR